MRRVRPAAAVIAVIGLVVTGLAGAASGSSPTPGMIVYPHMTPDGDRLQSHPLLTSLTDGTGITQITTGGPGWDIEPRWSPDGTRVAFTRVESDGLLSTIWVVNADGSEPHRVSEGPSYAEIAKWSPNGDWIAFQEQSSFGSRGARDDSSYELWIVRPDGSGLRALEAGGELGDAQTMIAAGNAWSWSPDSKLIAYVDGGAVMVVNVTTASKRRLANGEYPRWSPNGRKVAFVDRCRVWLVPARGGKRTPVTPHTKNDCHSDLAWSPDGRWIASTVTTEPPPKRDLSPLLVSTPDGKRHSRVPPIRAAAVKWPRDCGRLFLYEGYDMGVGWIVHGARGSLRWVKLAFASEPSIDWRC